MTKSDSDYVTDCSLYLRSVTVEDAGKYKVTARNDLGESNATISLNFDSKLLHFSITYYGSFIYSTWAQFHQDIYDQLLRS